MLMIDFMVVEEWAVLVVLARDGRENGNQQNWRPAPVGF